MTRISSSAMNEIMVPPPGYRALNATDRERIG